MHADETQFLLELKNHPHDDSVREVYADWLEERGDTRGGFLRLLTSISRVKNADDLSDSLSELKSLRESIEDQWLLEINHAWTVAEWTEREFQKMKLLPTNRVITQIWAPWSGPCRLMSKVMDDIARDYQGWLTIGRINVDDCPEFCAAHKISSVPTIQFFLDGELVDTMIGVTTYDKVANVFSL